MCECDNLCNVYVDIYGKRFYNQFDNNENHYHLGVVGGNNS